MATFIEVKESTDGTENTFTDSGRIIGWLRSAIHRIGGHWA